MKRITFWPQFVLGLTFKWGALVGWAAMTGSLSLAAIVLYAGSVLWTIGYDTIYAHQDTEDDAARGPQVDRAQIWRGDTALARAILHGRGVLWGAAGMHGRRPRRIRCGAGFGGRAIGLANGHARHKQRRQLPRTIQIEPAGWLAAVRRPGADMAISAL